MTDFSDLLTPASHETGVEVEILNPSTLASLENPIFIKLAGAGSKRFRAAKSEALAQAIKEKADGKELDVNEVEIKILTACTIGWRGIKENKKELEFSVEKCEQLYRGSDFVFDQCLAFINNRENFTKG